MMGGAERKLTRSLKSTSWYPGSFRIPDLNSKASASIMATHELHYLLSVEGGIGSSEGGIHGHLMCSGLFVDYSYIIAIPP